MTHHFTNGFLMEIQEYDISSFFLFVSTKAMTCVLERDVNADEKRATSNAVSSWPPRKVHRLLLFYNTILLSRRRKGSKGKRLQPLGSLVQTAKRLLLDPRMMAFPFQLQCLMSSSRTDEILLMNLRPNFCFSFI